MKTKIEKIKNVIYDFKCSEWTGSFQNGQESEPVITNCNGELDANGVCKKCGHQNKPISEYDLVGTIWYRVENNKNSKTAEFSVDANEKDTEIFEKKLISAMRRTGVKLNGVWEDGCKNPDGYDGYFGYYLSQKIGGGFNPDGRYSLTKI